MRKYRLASYLIRIRNLGPHQFGVRISLSRGLTTGCVQHAESVNSQRNSLPSSYSFVTTPIFYVNSQPHIGHLYTTVLADAYHRFQKLRREDEIPAFLYAGTDEHGMKIEKAAKAAGCKSVLSHCDMVSGEFKAMNDRFSIDYCDFVRTTEERHKEAVSHFWKLLRDKGYIYMSNYEGWYCVSDESFVPNSSVSERSDGTKFSEESGHPVEWSSEKNYMFKLKSLLPDVLHWVRTERPISPEKFGDILMRWIEEDFQDLSVSRPKSRLTWGIPVPDDSSQVIYVWLDALVNYLTVTGYPNWKTSNNPRGVWPPTLQVIGKDILKFHGMYWPAFLIAAGLEPPRKILCHSHWTVDNQKMSKSLGNVVNPTAMSEKYGVEGLRYFLLREGTPHSDGNFNEEKMRRLLNAELADTLGNLLNRCTSKTINPSQIWPSTERHTDSLPSDGQKLIDSLEELIDKVEASYENLTFYRGLEHIMATVRLANVYVENEKPWLLVKQSPEDPHLVAMLNSVFETLRVVAIMLQPIIPNLSSLILDRLSIPVRERKWQNIRPFIWSSLDPGNKRDLGSFKSVFYSRVKQ